MLFWQPSLKPRLFNQITKCSFFSTILTSTKCFLLYTIRSLHWVKTVQIKRLFGSKYEYMQTRKNSVFGHILRCDIKISQILPEACLESCQIFIMKLFCKNSFQLKAMYYLRKNAPSQIFDRFLNMTLYFAIKL